MIKDKLSIKIWKIIEEGNGDEEYAIIKFIDKCSVKDFRKLKLMKDH